MKKILYVFLIILTMFGCAGNKKCHKTSSSKPRKILTADIPVWFYDIPQHSTTGIGIGINEQNAKENAARQIALFEKGHVVCKFCEYDNERDKLGLQLKKMEFKFSEIIDSTRHQEILNSLTLVDGVNIRGDYIGLFSNSEFEVSPGNRTVSENDIPEWYEDGQEVKVDGSLISGFGKGSSHTIGRAFEKAYNDALYKFSRYISTNVESYIYEKTDIQIRNATAIESDIIIKNVNLVKLFVIPSSDSVGLQQYKVFCQISWDQQQEIIDLK